MSDPINPMERQPARDPNPTRSADPIQPSWLTDPYASDRYPVPEEPAPVVEQERLFSRRVLFGWALATLLVVFAITVILPMVVPLVRDSVTASVMAKMKERGVNVRMDGHNVRVDGPNAPVAPGAPAAAAIPEVPALPPVPANAAPAVAGTPATALAPATNGHHTKVAAPATKDRR